MTRFALLCALAVCTAFAQKEDTGAKGSISGTVTDSVSGAPIRKVQVKIGGSIAVTDASGSYRFENVPPGSCAINASRPDYPAVAGEGFALIDLAAGERRTGVDIKLSPAAVISGRIVDTDGDPLGNCSVVLRARGVPNARINFDATTDSNGEYALRTVPRGRYYLRARCSAPNLQPRPFAPPNARLPGPRLGYGPRFYPGARDLNAAQKIKAAAGQELRGMDFRMAPEIVSPLAVHITGLPAAQRGSRTSAFASLILDDGSPKELNQAYMGSVDPRTGEARIGSVPPGKYLLKIISAGNGLRILAKQPVVVNEDPVEVTVQVSQPVSLAGIMKVEKQDSAVSRNAPEPQATRISFALEDEPGIAYQADVDAAGNFTAKDIPPGYYRISPNQGSFIQSVTMGNERFEGPEFDLKPGASGLLEIRTGAATGTVSGDVEIGSAKPGKITIIATFGRTQSELEFATGQPPHYTVHMPPGSYRLYAVETGKGEDMFRLLNDEKLAAKGESVDFRSGAETVKNLRLITAEEIEKADP